LVVLHLLLAQVERAELSHYLLRVFPVLPSVLTQLMYLAEPVTLQPEVTRVISL
jgi:hypothetical protein